MEMTLAERYRRHATWCEEMAKSYRDDAEKVQDPQKSRWIESAKRLEDDASWYNAHSEMFQ